MLLLASASAAVPSMGAESSPLLPSGPGRLPHAHLSLIREDDASTILNPVCGLPTQLALGTLVPGPLGISGFNGTGSFNALDATNRTRCFSVVLPPEKAEKAKLPVVVWFRAPSCESLSGEGGSHGTLPVLVYTRPYH